MIVNITTSLKDSEPDVLGDIHPGVQENCTEDSKITHPRMKDLVLFYKIWVEHRGKGDWILVDKESLRD